jgi:hypothetical protein
MVGHHDLEAVMSMTSEIDDEACPICRGEVAAAISRRRPMNATPRGDTTGIIEPAPPSPSTRRTGGEGPHLPHQLGLPFRVAG